MNHVATLLIKGPLVQTTDCVRLVHSAAVWLYINGHSLLSADWFSHVSI